MVDIIYEHSLFIDVCRCYWDTSNVGVLWRDGVKQSSASDILSRPFPVSVAGTNLKYSFDYNSKIFKLSFNPNTSISDPSIIYAPDHIYNNSLEMKHSEDLLVKRSVDNGQYLEVSFVPGSSSPDKSWLVLGVTNNIPSLRHQSWLETVFSYIPFFKK